MSVMRAVCSRAVRISGVDPAAAQSHPSGGHTGLAESRQPAELERNSSDALHPQPFTGEDASAEPY
ncbi:hypothetical protein KCP78_25555 [Salmonella enterica subsp. enterica]|nr:hypothetical protein KCP78_25555 [Salmonella enterica subsp. enterica]